MDNPDWIQEKIDSINAAKNNNTEEEVLEGMQEDVYTIGKTDFTSSFWSAWSKYYVVPDGEKWNAQFNLNINSSDNTYYKNFALVITNDNARGETNYKEYGVIRFDATNDTAKYNSIWGNNIYFKYSNSNMLLDPVDNKDANLQKLGGKITLTVDRSQEGKFFVKITNGKVTKTYNQPFALPNLNTDATNKNIRCFVFLMVLTLTSFQQILFLKAVVLLLSTRHLYLWFSTTYLMKLTLAHLLMMLWLMCQQPLPMRKV